MGRLWLSAPLLLFIAGLILHQLPLMLVSIIIFLAGVMAKLWGRYCLDRVEYHRKLSSDRVFWGEEVHLDVEITNRKLLPLFWLQIDDEISPDITFLKGRTSPTGTADRMLLNNFLSLSWYHRLTRKYPIKCRQRGYFAFGPTSISSGDLFGFNRKKKEIDEFIYLTVYPRVLPLEKLGIPARQLFGDIRLDKHLFQDPVLTSGVRDYSSGDSLKQIHWKSTARRGRIQTKLFEPTTTLDLGIFLDVRTVDPPLWGSVPRFLEMNMVTAASVSHYAINKGFRVGLYINQNPWGSKELTVKLPPSQQADQELRIMEALARAHESPTIPMSRLVLREVRNLPWGSTILVISAVITEDLLTSLITIKRSGRKVALITTGNPDSVINKDGLTMYRIGDKVKWDELESLKIDKAGMAVN